MITAHGVELRVGARVLLSEANFRVASGDRIGLVGRNGAGKTTLTKTLAGETLPSGGQIVRGTDIGYLPQDPRTGDLEVLAMDRVLSARGLDKVISKMRQAEGEMASLDEATQTAAMERYPKLEARFLAAGGYAAESEAQIITAILGLDERVLGQPLGTLSGGQRRRIELARILFSGVETLLLDEPTNHLDLDSKEVLLDALVDYGGTLIFVSHDRYFVERLATKIIEVGNGAAIVYPGTYKEFLWHKEHPQGQDGRDRQPREKIAAPRPAPPKLVESREQKKKIDADARKRQRAAQAHQQRIDQLEARIAECEAEIRELEQAMSAPGFYDDRAAAQPIVDKHQALMWKVGDLMHQWEELQSTPDVPA